MTPDPPDPVRALTKHATNERAGSSDELPVASAYGRDIVATPGADVPAHGSTCSGHRQLDAPATPRRVAPADEPVARFTGCLPDDAPIRRRLRLRAVAP